MVSDHAKAFKSAELHYWATPRNIEVEVGSPYNSHSNGSAERLIRDLKMFMAMYPEHAGDWKSCLEAPVRHHNRSFCSTIGCTPKL